MILGIGLLIPQEIFPQNQAPKEIQQHTEGSRNRRWPWQSEYNTTNIVKQKHLRKTAAHAHLSTVISIGLYIP